MSDGMVQQLKKVGSLFTFEFFLEVWKPKLVEMLTKWLSPYSEEELSRMVRQGEFPDVSSLDFVAVTPYLKYIERMSVERLFEEYLEPAAGLNGYKFASLSDEVQRWFTDLRLYLLEKIRLGEKVADATPKEDIALATCDACGKSWPVPKEENIKECPFCHEAA